MVIAGSQGHAREVFEILKLNGFNNENIAFYDDVNSRNDINIPKNTILLQSVNEVKAWMEHNEDYNYVYGLGGIQAKETIFNKLQAIGGILNQVISSTAVMGNENIRLGTGVQVMHSTIITTHVKVGDHCLLNAGSQLMHDVIIGSHCDIAPGAILLGRAVIGNHCFIGANSTILPDIIIGDNVTIGAGSVVTQDIPANTVAVGVPARVIKNK